MCYGYGIPRHGVREPDCNDQTQNAAGHSLYRLILRDFINQRMSRIVPHYVDLLGNRVGLEVMFQCQSMKSPTLMDAMESHWKAVAVNSSKYAVVVMPGNPGSLPFYQSFVERLYEGLHEQIPVVASTLLMFSTSNSQVEWSLNSVHL